MKENYTTEETQKLNYSLEAISINGKNFITLSKEEWVVEETKDLLILSKKDPQ